MRLNTETNGSLFSQASEWLCSQAKHLPAFFEGSARAKPFATFPVRARLIACFTFPRETLVVIMLPNTV